MGVVGGLRWVSGGWLAGWWSRWFIGWFTVSREIRFSWLVLLLLSSLKLTVGLIETVHSPQNFLYLHLSCELFETLRLLLLNTENQLK